MASSSKRPLSWCGSADASISQQKLQMVPVPWWHRSGIAPCAWLWHRSTDAFPTKQTFAVRETTGRLQSSSKQAGVPERTAITAGTSLEPGGFGLSLGAQTNDDFALPSPALLGEQEHNHGFTFPGEMTVPGRSIYEVP